MRELLEHPWVKILLIATAIAMCTFALRETAWITQPIAKAVGEVLVPVAIGFAIAYVLTPVVDAIARQGGVRRFVAAGALFLVVAAGLGLVLTLVVPAVVHEGSALTARVFQGEPYTDLDRNGRYDPGEPFEDSNGNQVWDRGLLASGLARLEDWQGRLKAKARLAFDEPELTYLALYADDTAGLRGYLGRLLEAGRAGEPAERWPAAPAEIDEAAGDATRDFAWPSPPAQGVADAAASVAPELRERWQRLARAADAALAERNERLLGALAAARSGADDPLAARLREAWRQPLGPERRGVAQELAKQLEEAYLRGQPGARRMLAALRGGDEGMASRTLAALVQQVDAAVRGSLQNSPSLIGDWTRAGVSNVGSVFSLAIDALLVPIYAFFLILAMPNVREGVRQYIPTRGRERTLRIIHDIERVVSAFFRGRLIICVLCSFACWVGFSAIGLFTDVKVPYAALFAIAIGFATTVPLSGLLFLAPALVMTMLQPQATPLHAMLVAGVYLLIQGLEAVLIPTVMGREVELHPVVLIVALLLCGKLLGIIGLILAVPIAATCRILAREYLWPRLRDWAAAPAPGGHTGTGPGTDDGTPPGVPVLRDHH